MALRGSAFMIMWHGRNGGMAVSLLMVSLAWANGGHAQSWTSMPVTPEQCEASAPLSFVCGAGQPEDLARLPDTPWILVSGFSPGSGLKLLNIRTKQLQRWNGQRASEWAFDREAYPQCPGRPDRHDERPGHQPRARAWRSLSTAGQQSWREGSHRSVRDTARPAGRIGHAGRSVGRMPAPAAGLAANSVSSFPTARCWQRYSRFPGARWPTTWRGVTAVWCWSGLRARRPSVKCREPGCRADDGIEADPDNRHFYVVAFGRHAIVGFERGRRARRLFEAVAPGFMPDNIHWDGKRLLAAGMQYDEPACGGLRKGRRRRCRRP